MADIKSRQSQSQLLRRRNQPQPSGLRKVRILLFVTHAVYDNSKRPVKAIWGRDRPVELHHIILLLRTSQVALVIKNSPATGGDIRDLGSWVGKMPWRKAWQPTPVFLPGEFHRDRDREAWRATVHRVAKTRKR